MKGFGKFLGLAAAGCAAAYAAYKIKKRSEEKKPIQVFSTSFDTEENNELLDEQEDFSVQDNTDFYDLNMTVPEIETVKITPVASTLKNDRLDPTKIASAEDFYDYDPGCQS